MLARRIPSRRWLASLAVSLALPVVPALAQNAAVFKAGDALMQCLQSVGEVRPVERAADLAHSVAAADSFGWVPSEVSAGIWRLDRKEAGFGLSMEIRLVGADGNAHCIAFGPDLTQADADAAVDRFAASGRLGSIGSAALGQGMSRRYVIGGLSHTAELLSYSAPGTGAVVGLSFAGVSPQTVSALQGSAQQAQPAPAQTAPAVAIANSVSGDALQNFTLATALCLQHNHSGSAIVTALQQAGYSMTPSQIHDTKDFTAPGIEGWVIFETPSPMCYVSSKTVSYEQAQSAGRAVAEQFFPGAVQDGVAGSHYTGCAGLTIAAPSKRIEMEILNPAACDSAGGTSIRLSM
ncbi:hypothetical protein [Pseudooceanicola sp.]|uniref:hypothetical protein n=1 Tax=Pseudooceanicola sp. TaxID=1914328 RepID=UPI0035145B8B